MRAAGPEDRSHHPPFRSRNRIVHHNKKANWLINLPHFASFSSFQRQACSQRRCFKRSRTR